MNRRSVRALLVLGSFLLVLTSCAPDRGAPQVAKVAATPPTKSSPTPKRTTPTPKPPTSTTLPPTAAPTIAPSSSQAAGEPFAPQQPVEAPPGWKHYDKSAAGFSFALPPQWQVADLDREDADAMIEEMEGVIPEMGQLGGTTRSLLAQGIKVVACDCTEMSETTTMPTNMNIIVQPVSPQASFDMAVTSAINALEAMSFTIKPIKHTRIPHPTVKAEAIQYRSRLPTVDGTAGTFTSTQYLLMNDSAMVIVTITATIAKAEELTPTFYKIIQTFRLASLNSQPM